jgi:peroxiredoxin
MKRISIILIVIIPFLFCAEKKDETTLTTLGQEAPDFRVTTLAGETFSLSDLRGKVVWINFFATWCPPCNEEMPELETQVWQAFQGDDFTVLSIGREHTAEELIPFKAEKAVSFPMAPDPERKIYGLYAEKFIPRNVLVDGEGKIVHQSRGFTPEDFKAMKIKLKELLN